MKIQPPPSTPPKPKRVSMQTIAELAGVSATAVSLALRDHPSISAETKGKIHQIRQSLGYKSSPRRVKAKQPHRPSLEQVIYRTVGVDMRHDTYAPFLNGIIFECRLRGVRLELDSLPISDLTQFSPAGLESVPEHGIILSGRVTDRDVEAVAESRLPFLVLGNYRLSKPVHMVGVDHIDASERSMGDLISQGMKQAVFVVENKDRVYERDFLQFLRAALIKFGISNEDILVFESGAEFSRIEQALTVVVGHLKPGGRLICIERHCAEILAQKLPPSFFQDAAGRQIISFITDPYRLSTTGALFFDMGLELCGRLAVARLTELQRYPDLPINSCMVRPPGWVS